MSSGFFPWALKSPILKEDGTKVVQCRVSLMGALEGKGNRSLREMLWRHVQILRGCQNDQKALEELDKFLQIWSDD